MHGSSLHYGSGSAMQPQGSITTKQQQHARQQSMAGTQRTGTQLLQPPSSPHSATS